MKNGDKRNERLFKDEVARRYDIDPALLEHLPNLLDGTLDNIADLLGQGIDWVRDVLGGYQSTKEQTDQLLDWVNETFKNNFSELKNAVEEFVEDRIDDKIDEELRKRATKLTVSREELLQRYAEIRAAVVADIAVKLKFHAQNFADGYAAYEALQAASGAAPAHQSIHVQKFEDRFSSILRRFATADEKVTDLSVIEALRRSDTLSVERIFQEEIGELHGALVSELIRAFGAAGGIARAFIEAHKNGELSSANAKIIAKNFGEILRGSATGVAATEKAFRKGKSLKVRVLGWIFNIRTAALGLGAAVLVALGLVVQAVPDNWLLGISDNVWSAILFAILGVGLLTALIRVGGLARIAGGLISVLLLVLMFGSRTETGNDLLSARVDGDNDRPNYWNLFPDTTQRPSDFGDGCTGKEIPGYQCMNIFFATPRKVEFTPDARFTKFMEDNRLHLGRAELQVPKPGYIGDEADASCPEGYFCRDQIDRSEVASDFSRRLNELFKVTLLTTTKGENFVQEKERFVKSFNEALLESDNKTFLYIHGFNQTFDQAIKTAALMNVDLKGLYRNYETEVPGKEILSRRNLGVPIVFSWPNRENGAQYLCDKGTSEPGEPGHQLMCGKRDSEMSVNTIAPYLNQTLRILLADTSTNELNIVVHSLGNRLLLNSLKKFASDFSSVSGRDLTVRIVHAAADINHTEYYEVMSDAIRVISANDAGTINLNPEVTNYTSRTDGAHILSRIAVARVRCRLGRFHEGKFRPCPPFQASDFSLRSINASGFVARNAYKKGRTDLGHGYIENSPTIIADIGCALAGFRPDGTERALVYVEDVQARKKWEYYDFDSERGLSVCKSTRFLPLLMNCDHTNKANDPNCADEFVLITRETRINLAGFELLKASLPPSFGDFMRRFEDTAHEADEIVSVEIAGFADTSGEQSLNAKISQRRSEAVKAALIQWFFERSLPTPVITAFGKGEVSLEENKAEDTSDGVRSELNRRVEVVITYKIAVPRKEQ